MILFLQNKNITAHLCCCTCSFHSCCTTTNNDNITVLVDFECFINITFRYCRVYSTTDRTIDTDTVSGTSDVAGDTFTKEIFLSVLNLLNPVRLCNKATSHSDDIYVTTLKYFLYYLRVTVVTCINNRFSKLVFHSS